jgi:methionyl-tRNA formyltransferase
MRIIFMGTPLPAAVILDSILKMNHEIVAAVTQPDRPQGRGLKIRKPAVKELAENKSIMVLQPEKIDGEFINAIKDLRPDLAVVVAYGKILPKALIDVFPKGCINVHASLLPRYRGAAPIQWAILNGDGETGITIMKINEELDTGDILLQEKIAINPNDTAESLSEKLFECGSKIINEAVIQIEEGKARFVPQTSEKATFAPSLKKEMGRINWSETAQKIRDKIRAFNPWPGAFTIIGGKALKVWEAELLEEDSGGAGEIYCIEKGRGFKVGCGMGALLVTKVQIEGGKKQAADQFVNGHRLKTGIILS